MCFNKSYWSNHISLCLMVKWIFNCYVDETPAAVGTCVSEAALQKARGQLLLSQSKFQAAVVLLPQSAISFASCSRRLCSLGPCSVKSELSRQTRTVPVPSPAASSPGCLALNSKQ